MGEVDQKKQQGEPDRRPPQPPRQESALDKVGTVEEERRNQMGNQEHDVPPTKTQGAKTVQIHSILRSSQASP